MVRHFSFFRCACVFGLALLACHASAAPLYKCKNASGQTVYSDIDCRTNIPVAAPRPAQPISKFAQTAPVDKLSQAVVENVLQLARESSDRFDHTTLCGLAAPDLTFNLVDHSTSPAIVKSGGQRAVCKLQRESARELQSNGLSVSSALSQMKIQVSEDGSQATAKYVLTARVSVNGTPAFGMRCDKDEVLALYSGKALFKRASSSCSPTP
ncbi:DUF4124 domain-containing protein [Hydrogenophaga sp. A37]|uniref:DUF4124 domain-containing protein n=1 Tax=Hydrogenophaga sp. A37 TaxID=1945864 RepID=UPI0009869740|nr:DUF4124 domain-containing protein [Hydrogenophaga sp. A37]OOG81917.1 hypothetical protein B0E41_16590 [Hydrogenophaga sp. A37]